MTIIRSTRSLSAAVTLAFTLGSSFLGACGGTADGAATEDGASNPETSAEPSDLAQTDQALIGGSGITQASKSFTVAAGQSFIATATCPANSVVVAGGYQVPSGVRVIESRSAASTSVNGWQIQVINQSSAFLQLSGSVFAQCLSGTRAAKASTLGPTVTIGPGATNCSSAFCGGTPKMGVGFLASSAFNVTNVVASGSGFAVCGKNDNPSQSISFTSFVSCAGNVTGGPREQTVTATIPPTFRGSTRVQSATCAGGTLLSFGALSSVSSPSLVTLSTMRSGNTWVVDVVNPTSTNQSVTLSTYCEDLFQ